MTDIQSTNHNNKNQKLTKAEVIDYERRLAKFANAMDSLVRIPFTKQGVGADTALSTMPIAGDIAGLVLTAYAFFMGRKMGVPMHKMLPAVRLAIADLFVGIIPVAGTLMDIFIRPSRKTLDIVHTHIRETYDLTDDFHVERPFLHEALEKRQAKTGLSGAFWRNSLVSWLWLHIPDMLGVLVLVLIGMALYGGIRFIIGLFS